MGKFDFSLGGFGRASYNTPGDFTNTQTVTGLTNDDYYETIQSASTKNKGLFGRYNFGMDYDVSEHNSLSLGVVLGANNHPTDQYDFLTDNYLNNVLVSPMLQNNYITNNSSQVDATLTYALTEKKPNREFSFLTEYSQNNQVYNYENVFLDQASGAITNGLKNIDNSVNKEVTFEADYQTPTFKDQLLEFGAKDIIRSVSNDYSYFSAADGSLNYVPVSSADLSNNFNYNKTWRPPTYHIRWCRLKIIR